MYMSFMKGSLNGMMSKLFCLCRVKVRTDESQNNSQWQDWDDEWDEGSSSARRGNSVKQKRSQKWDEDW